MFTRFGGEDPGESSAGQTMNCGREKVGVISNWFINARVRLWKPMVEDIYKEEFGENEMDSNSSSENAIKGEEDEHSLSTERYRTNQSGQPSFQNEPPNLRAHESSRIDLLHGAIFPAEGSSSLVTCSTTELGRHGNGGVSLTLGLQHSDGILPASDEHEGFIPGFGPSHCQLLHDFGA
ncbi:BEL1-like homeodomain protein 7 [Platanthera guangdongensis]|uniref:BEL1-like homeodomain protein 7 n=1 Tax=Platanthera guangdongensis TaxID=2320717 RepID=A0ABR2LWT1_9ASPA